MKDRWGLGPVFEFEWLTGSRSPRVYAIRAGFVLVLLIVLFAASWSGNQGKTHPSIRDYAQAGAFFFLGLVGAQLVLVMLAAPAATAGAICQERSRGSLTHLLVTDLSDPEIVLGKLAARLVPTLALVLCALPVQFLASFLGGIDPDALMASTLITLGVAVFACSLALTFSVWGKKTQDVLVATYVVLIAWLLIFPTSMGFGWSSPWFWKLDPFQLALARYSANPTSTDRLDILVFLGLMLGLSVVLIAVAVRKFRIVAVREDRPGAVKPRRDWRWARRFTPSLDRDPILWREWHRARPSKWARAIWWIYYVVAVVFSGLAIERSLRIGGDNVFGMLVIGFEAAIGFLLLSVDAATSLAEERARGSLDVLMTTPLSTRSIVWGKWRGTYQRVFGLAILPATITLFGMEKENRALGAGICLGLVLAYGAAITSLGLAMATWVKRLGRAVALSAGIYALVTVGGFFVVFAGLTPSGWEAEIATMSPFYGPIYAMDSFDDAKSQFIGSLAPAGWMAFYVLLAMLLLLATLATFDRCMGRSRGRRLPSSRRSRSRSDPAASHSPPRQDRLEPLPELVSTLNLSREFTA